MPGNMSQDIRKSTKIETARLNLHFAVEVGLVTTACALIPVFMLWTIGAFVLLDALWVEDWAGMRILFVISFFLLIPFGLSAVQDYRSATEQQSEPERTKRRKPPSKKR